MSAPRISSPPRIVARASELRALLAEARAAGQTIGLVPTMGALHAGHLSLVAASRRDCEVTVVTIFVNPTQFGPGEDFGRYPRNLEEDLRLLTGGADIVFAPTTESMYASGHATSVEVVGPAIPLEGTFRPGHFRGVATIVLKLFNIVQPDRAYFGRKDYQQTLVVRHLIDDLDLPIELVVCPIVREADGLALSSRNVYLSADERRRALAISESLRLAKSLVEQGTVEVTTIVDRMRKHLEAAELKIDYVALADPATLAPLEVVQRPAVALIAARVGPTRLIDNEMIA